MRTLQFSGPSEKYLLNLGGDPNAFCKLRMAADDSPGE
jgi:hypothetical protein